MFYIYCRYMYCNSIDNMICTLQLFHWVQLLLMLLRCTDCGVAGQRPAGVEKLVLLSSASGFHQGHQHSPAIHADQHPAGPPHLQGPARPFRQSQGKPTAVEGCGTERPLRYRYVDMNESIFPWNKSQAGVLEFSITVLKWYCAPHTSYHRLVFQ